MKGEKLSNENNIKKINEKELTKSQLLIILSSIATIGLFLRIYYLPFDIPITLDGLIFFWYANDISLLGSLPLDYTPANNGWPIFLSFFFQLFDSNNFMEYMVLQRLVTVILSVLTIIPIYFLCRKFFSEKFALVGSTIFALEPRIIQNSVFGVTEPLFILLVTASIVCFLNKSKQIIFLSFSLIALATIVRSEAIVLLIPFSILYVIRFRNSKKIIYETPLLILVFVLIITPISIYTIDVTGNDAIFSRIPNIDSDSNKSLENQKNPQTFEEMKHVFMMVGWASIPIFIFLVPYGIFRMFKERKMKNVSVITILFFMSIPAIYAVAFLPDTKYLYVLYPILCLISVFSVKKFVNIFSNKNLVLLTLVSFILIASISFLEIKKIDVSHENDALEIAGIISQHTKIINQFAMESGYLSIIGMNELEKFPILRNDFVDKNQNMKYCVEIHSCKYIIPVETDSIIEFLKNSEKKGITHLIIDDREQRRAKFVSDIFQNENKFSYLTKIYDSKDNKFSYNMKIFKIDFDKFNELYSEKNS
jgi:hypothetical protein